jgi:hypothetical protein
LTRIRTEDRRTEQGLEAQIPNEKFQIPNKFQYPMFQIQKVEIFKNGME